MSTQTVKTRKPKIGLSSATPPPAPDVVQGAQPKKRRGAAPTPAAPAIEPEAPATLPNALGLILGAPQPLQSVPADLLERAKASGLPPGDYMQYALLDELPGVALTAERLQQELEALRVEVKAKEEELKGIKEDTEALLIACGIDKDTPVSCYGLAVKQTANIGREVIIALELVEKGVDPLVVRACTHRVGAWTSVSFTRVAGEPPSRIDS